MTNSLESSTSFNSETEAAQPSGWLKLGALAAVSALAGGLAAAWWYRKTLIKLRQADESAPNPHFGIPGDDPEDEA
jgi:cytoskeletal protein RodZ